MFYSGTAPIKYSWQTLNSDSTPEQPKFGSNTIWGNYILYTNSDNFLFVYDVTSAKILKRYTISIPDADFSFFVRDCATIGNSLYLLIFDSTTLQPYLALHNIQPEQLFSAYTLPLSFTLIPLPYSITNSIPNDHIYYRIVTFEVLQRIPHQLLCYHPRYCSLSSHGGMLTFCYNLCALEDISEPYPIISCQFFTYVDPSGIFYGTTKIDDSYIEFDIPEEGLGEDETKYDYATLKRCMNTTGFSGYVTAHSYHVDHVVVAQQHPIFSSCFLFFYFKDNVLTKSPAPYSLDANLSDITSITSFAYKLFFVYNEAPYVSLLSYLGIKTPDTPPNITLPYIYLGNVSKDKYVEKRFELVNISPYSTFSSLNLFTQSKGLLLSTDGVNYTQSIFLDQTLPPGDTITLFCKYHSEYYTPTTIIESIFIKAHETK